MIKKYEIVEFLGKERKIREDLVIEESPLEVEFCYNRECKSVIIMRTPIDEEELILGFAFTQGLISSIRDVESIERIHENKIRVNILNKIIKISKDFIDSSCGICGSSFIEFIKDIISKKFKVESKVIFSLPIKLKENQKLFNITGALHAAGLFDTEGNLLAISEDVGRHNAVDKAIGKLLKSNMIPPPPSILQVSGRAGYEIVLKALIARIPIVSSISAPTSGAIELARASGITLISFLRNERFNVYSHEERLI
ncbi:MAG: formate dehydrogenase accessory sulfurtransferase FdhD [Sulfolobales archaeon]